MTRPGTRRVTGDRRVQFGGVPRLPPPGPVGARGRDLRPARWRSRTGVVAGLVLLLAAIGLAVVILVPGAAPPRPVALPPPVARIAPGSVLWGAELGTQFTGEAVPWDMRGLSRFQAEIGRAPAVVAFNLPFQNCYATGCIGESFPTGQMSALRRYGSIPFVNWASESSPLTG